MRKKTPGSRCRPSSAPLSPDSMDDMDLEDFSVPLEGKLGCPSLAVMITKTIKALCEVNVRFNQKLEISGCLHVRSDNEKVLTCLIDEETARVKQEEAFVNQRHEPIVSMLNNTLALQKAKRSPLIPPETEPLPPQPQYSQPQRESTVVKLVEEGVRVAIENTRQVIQANAQQRLLTNPTGSLSSGISDPFRPSLQNQDILRAEKNPSSPSESDSEPHDEPNNLEVNMPGIKLEPDIQQYTPPPPPQQPAPIMPPISIAPQYDLKQAINNNNKVKQPTVDNIPYEKLEVVTAKGGRTTKFQCMFCGIMLSTKGYLKNHINAVHTKAKVYPCDICNRLFYSAGALRIHKLRHHWAGSKKHKCTLCKDAFLLPIELRRHLSKKHNVSGAKHSSPSPANHNDSSSEHAAEGGGSGASQEGDHSPPRPDGEDGSLEAHMKATQLAAQTHLQMVHDMARISQAQACNDQAME